ncbi:hypothetical protein [Kineosporia babensis]|uniref:Uncharacterized protein n=1 Tax=Kineosporia babensis TaxID=499548 RepID=A0A9X1NB04_9ACTN|nr:hypothetical protein [Kineosporia babensis]MCD5310790.1 hypothetical protein [Kineosporia babensis]
MTAILQIVDGLNGPLVMELNRVLNGQGGLIGRGHNLAEGQLAGFVQGEAQWSPLSGQTALGRRTISIPVTLWEQSHDLLGQRVSKLMQCTSQPWWLRIRRSGGTQNSWLRCFPCTPQIETVISASNSAPVARGQIVAETDPYAYGARVDGGEVLVPQDPLNSSAWKRDILDVPGDAITPLLLRLNDEAAFSAAFGAFVSMRRRQTPAEVYSSKLIRQAESSANTRAGTPGEITFTTLTGDAALSQDAGVRVNFLSGYPAGRSGSITFAEPTLTGANAVGTYRMFVRVRRNGNANNQHLVMRAFTNNSNLAPDEVVVPAGGAATRLVDLGLVQWPSAQPATIMAPIPTPSNADATPVTLQIWRRSAGAATVDIDYMIWVPADEDSGYLETDSALLQPATQFVNVDGFSHQAVLTSSDPRGPHVIVGQGYGANTPTPRWVGGAPHVRPGNNRLFIVAGTTASSVWPKGRDISVRYSYWPRFAWLR